MLWITGANGLLGSAIARKTAALTTGRELDIADFHAVQTFLLQHPEITHVINCAAFSQVDPAELKKEEAFRTNALGPQLLQKACSERGVQLIHISTDYVFPGNVHKPLSETDQVGPCNYYGVTKLEGEKGLSCVIRTSWIFGAGGKNFVSKLLEMLQVEKEIRLVNDQWGRFTYAPDLADALLQLLDAKGLYQYANRGVVTKYEFGLAMRQEALALGFPVVTESIIPVSSSAFPSPCKRPVYSAFDTSKIEALISIRSWREALKEFLCEKSKVFS